MIDACSDAAGCGGMPCGSCRLRAHFRSHWPLQTQHCQPCLRSQLTFFLPVAGVGAAAASSFSSAAASSRSNSASRAS